MEQSQTKRGSSHYLFLLTILTGSFLLFLVQPMVARMALPKLGGAPAVWNSAMLVYQALLLGGYAYAHKLSNMAPRRQVQIHIALFLIAAIWLPIKILDMALPNNGSPIFWVPWLLIASIGPLFFAVAAQAPLMQRWYNLAGNPGEPYALYAASNIGSFAGLLAYPLLVEPFISVKAQSWLWTGIYALLLVAIATCARNLWQSHAPSAKATEKPADLPAIPWSRKARWILLAAVPSGLMLSTTTHLTTDLVAMPLVWVIPLGLYLLSFSVAFADNQRPAHWITLAAAPIMLCSGAIVFAIWGKAAINGLAASLVLLFVVAVALHNEMYRLRPAPQQLTIFYLMMSVGGVVGGFFCAIVAPLIFDWSWEHPILILLAALLIPQKRLFSLGEEETFGKAGLARIMLLLGAIAMAAGVYVGKALPLELDTSKMLALAVIFSLGAIVTGYHVAFALAVAGLMIANGGWYNLSVSVEGQRWRSYFGTYTVNGSSDGMTRWLNHGTTMHGLQMLQMPTSPISYYDPASGVGLAMEKAPMLFGPHARIGVVGLGTGTLSCYTKPGQSWRFFEIDPLMIDIAKHKKIFSFIDKCNPDVPITLGDARLTLGEVPQHSFDMLAIDAFSSDAIPTHLLTKEAFDIYKRALAPSGLLLVHISNRYIDLEPVIAAEAKAGGWAVAMRMHSPMEEQEALGARASKWLALSQDPAKLAQLTGPLAAKQPVFYDAKTWVKLAPPGNTTAWTDDYASILPHLSYWKEIK